MTTRYAALLRGIAPVDPLMRNAPLRDVFTGLGYAEVSTVLSSGNLLFSTDADAAGLEAAIEDALERHLGAPCPAFVRSRARVVRLAATEVFDGHADEGDHRCTVTFLKAAPGRATEFPHEVGGSVVLALQDDALLSVVDTSRSAAVLRWIEREHGPVNTTRSWRSFRRIAARLASDG